MHTAFRLATSAGVGKDELRKQATRLAREAGVKAAVDSGIHARSWSRVRAVAFVTMHLGAGNAADVVDLVAATPGEALAVFAGAQKFTELRLAVEARLGERVDERAFDRIVLENGPLPLSLLEVQVEEVLKARSTAPQ